MSMQLFDSSCVMLDEYYFRAGHKNDFRFLLCSRQAFCENIPVLILDKRPGKNTLGIDYPKFSCEQGNAFFYFYWRRSQKAPGLSAVQLRMQSFYKDMKECLNMNMSLNSFTSNEVLIAYHNPFRDDCPTDKNFLYEFWCKILDNIYPKIIFTMAKEPFKMLEFYFSDIHNEKMWTKLDEFSEIQKDFNYKIYLYLARRHDHESLVVSIPSLFKYRYDEKGGEQEVANNTMWSKIKAFYLGRDDR